MLIRLERYGSPSVAGALIFSYSLKILNIYSFNSKLEIRGALKFYCIRGVLI